MAAGRFSWMSGIFGGHLDFTRRARASTLSKRVSEATVGVAAAGALPLVFQVKLGVGSW